jgi:N-acetyl sugar amidotransferase
MEHKASAASDPARPYAGRSEGRATYRVCTYCVMDSSDPEITFDAAGQCHHCRLYRETVFKLPRFRDGADLALARIVEKARRRAHGKRYDCIIGVSGGVDSTYLAYYVTKILKLRPLAVHLDNGWDSELAVQNIERMLRKLDIDLETEILDWHEFRSLQLAFLKSSTPDSEIPTDHAIFSTLYRTALTEGVGTIFLGVNRVTEFILPKLWSYGHRDWTYIDAINRRFGAAPLKTYPHTSVWRFFYLFKVRTIEVIRLYDYIDFDKKAVEAFIAAELGWQPYAAKHYESLYTKFYQGYLMPRKFGFDKRRAHLSSLICAGQVSRDQALAELQQPSLPPEDEAAMLDYVAKKLGIARDEFERICALPLKTYRDYPSVETDRLIALAKRVYRRLSSAPLRDGIVDP